MATQDIRAGLASISVGDRLAQPENEATIRPGVAGPCKRQEARAPRLASSRTRSSRCAFLATQAEKRPRAEVRHGQH